MSQWSRGLYDVLGGGHCRCCRSQSRGCHIKRSDSFVRVQGNLLVSRSETAGGQLSRRVVSCCVGWWRGCANIFWGVEDSSAWWVTNRSRIGKKSRQVRGCGAGNFCFWRSLFFPCLVGAASERVAWYKKCPGDKNTVLPRKGTSWSAELASLQNPAQGTKVSEGSDAWNLKKDGSRGCGLANKRYRQAIDTQLRWNRRHQKRSRILMGGREGVTWVGKQIDRLRLRERAGEAEELERLCGLETDTV